jgi:hypothetical protein
MRSSHSLDRLDVAFDADRLVADAGLLLPATLAQHLGLKVLVETHLDLGRSVGRSGGRPGEPRRQAPDLGPVGPRLWRLDRRRRRPSALSETMSREARADGDIRSA